MPLPYDTTGEKFRENAMIFPGGTFESRYRVRSVSIMVADIADFTTMIHVDEKEAIKLLEEMESLIAILAGQFGGHIVKFLGDGVLLSFEDPQQALRCGIRIQEEASRKTYEGRMILRIGLHYGRLLVREDSGDLIGDVVNIAFRVQQFADLGGMAMTRIFYEQIIYGNIVDPKRLCRIPGVTVRHVRERQDIFLLRTPGKPCQWWRIRRRLKGIACMETSRFYLYIPLVVGLLSLGLAAILARWPALIPTQRAIQEIRVPSVMGIVADSLNGKEVLVAWEAVEGAADYCVEYRRAWERGFTRLPGEYIHGNSALIPDLKTGDEYVIRVKALDSAGLIVGMKTRECIPLPWESPPMQSTFTEGNGMWAESQFNSTVRLGWVPVLGAASYRLEMGRGEDRFVPLGEKSAQDNEAVISGLTLGEAYSFKVKPLGRDGQEAKAMSVTHMTVKIDSPIEPPAGVAFNSGEVVSRLVWTAVPESAGYHVYYRPEGGKLMRATRVPEEHTELLLRSLKPGIYSFQASSIDRQGREGRQSRPIFAEVISR